MDLQTCYQMMGADYDEVKRRLSKDERIARFLQLFLKDENYRLLQENIASENWENAFRAAHSLKGVSLNLSLTPLVNASSAITEALRSAPPAGDVTPLLEDVLSAYALVEKAIRALPEDAAT